MLLLRGLERGPTFKGGLLQPKQEQTEHKGKTPQAKDKEFKEKERELGE